MLEKQKKLKVYNYCHFTNNKMKASEPDMWVYTHNPNIC